MPQILRSAWATNPDLSNKTWAKIFSRTIFRWKKISVAKFQENWPKKCSAEKLVGRCFFRPKTFGPWFFWLKMFSADNNFRRNLFRSQNFFGRKSFRPNFFFGRTVFPYYNSFQRRRRWYIHSNVYPHNMSYDRIHVHNWRRAGWKKISSEWIDCCSLIFP